MVSIRSHLAERFLRPLGIGRCQETRSALINTPRQRGVPPGLLVLNPFKGFSRIRELALGINLACGLCIACSAASLPAAAPSATFERWFSVQTNIQNWSADLTQTRSLTMLAQPLTAKGKVWVTASGQFRWELGEPAQTIALRQPDQLLLIYPRLKRAEKYSLSGVPPGPVKDALALLDATFPRDRAIMEERFRLLSAAETNSTLDVALEPKSASARKFISQIRISFRTNDFAITATEMKFADGSSLRNDFTNTVLNGPIDPALFEPKLPADFTVVEPLRK
jgi:outer membrane lipoprotein-sorting protein